MIKKLGLNNINVANLYKNLGQFYKKIGKFDLANKFQQKCNDILNN